MNQKVFAILVCYYPQYAEKAIYEIHNLLSMITDDFNLVVVANGENSYRQICNNRPNNTHIIQGSNESWEFSGWDEGINFIEENIEPSTLAHSKIVFANDTFCHHRKFLKIQKLWVASEIKKLSENQILGDIRKCSSQETILGAKFNRWLVTYLFACHWQDLKLIQPLDKVKQLNFLEKVRLINNRVEVPLSSPGIQSHLAKYLNNSGQEGGWTYKDPDEEIKLKKLHAIINEMAMTAYAEDLGGEIISFYPQSWKRELNRLFKRIFKG